MNKIHSIGIILTLLVTSSLMADKPEWAGKGAKPSEYEKEYHKQEMKSKHEYKKQKKEKKEKYYKKRSKNEKEYRNYEDRYDKNDVEYRRDRNYDSGGYRGQDYEGQGQSDGQFIEQKTDETKKNWIGKFFDFLN